MGNLSATWEDHGDHLRVVTIIWPRRNGLPNLACMHRAMQVLEQINPDAFDPMEPLPEIVARAAQRDGIVPEIVVMTENHPPVPVFEDDEIPGFRCGNGQCVGD